MKRSAIDSRFVDLAFFMSIGVWPWLLFVTFGSAAFAWQIVLGCQLVALLFAVPGWAMGFQVGRRFNFTLRNSAMVAGWSGLLCAEAGLFLVLLFWKNGDLKVAGLLAFPALAVLVTVGVFWFYRPSTWTKDVGSKQESTP